MLDVYLALLSQELIHTSKTHISYRMFLGFDLSSVINPNPTTQLPQKSGQVSNHSSSLTKSHSRGVEIIKALLLFITSNYHSLT